MFFYLHYRIQRGALPVTVRVLESPELHHPEEQVLYVGPGVQRLETIFLPDGSQLLLLGDPVGELQTPNSKLQTSNFKLQTLLETVRGHYYWFWVQGPSIRCGASFGAIFPLYHQLENDQVQISSSAFFLAGQTDPGAPDRRYLLERLLFNYAFFNRTWWTRIRLLPAHHGLRLHPSGIEVEKVLSVADYFGTGWRDKRSDLDELAAVFEAESRLFLPDAPFAVSFTGGFDGRTLVAAARAAGRRDFFTYSFGMPDESDLRFPAEQSRRLGIDYLPVCLDAGYVERHAGESARGFLHETDFFGNLGRPHYRYAARVLAEKTGYLLTGNFGSELFRAMHQPGVMMSAALIQIFAAPDDTWKDALRRAAGPQAAFFRNEIEDLIADLERYLADSPDTDPNRRFYRFVLEEIFRKYFGPELVMQARYLRNRTPYLSLPFFQKLNETRWAGVHARLFEKQKNKRLKGQQFYAAFLRRTDRQLYRLPTNKGYRPADVLDSWRLPLLLAGVARQKFFRQETGDSNAVEAFFSRYCREWDGYAQLAADPVWQNSGLARTLEDSPAGALEQNIQLHTLAAGWLAAQNLVYHDLITSNR
ncbi:MAG: hypothetical protein JNK89_04835 [Saprospiraceae bacterium]|nr:hypothetical protein [Saprospiraceae bacterium]